METVECGISHSKQEEREYGKIELKTYLIYLSACSMGMGILYIMLVLSWQGLRFYTDFWLSEWAQDSAFHNYDEVINLNFYISDVALYLILKYFIVILTMLCSLTQVA